MLGTLLAVSMLLPGQAEPGVAKTIVIPGRAPIVQALFSPDDRRVYFATQGGVEGHDLETGKLLFNVAGGRQLSSSPKGDLLAAVSVNIGMISIDGNIDVLDATSGKTLRTQAGTSAMFSPDSRWLISHSGYTWGRPGTDKPPNVQITDLRTGKTHLAQIGIAKGMQPGFRTDRTWGPFQFTRDSKALVTSSRDQFGKVEVLAACELETGKPMEALPKAEDLHLSRDSTHSADGKRYVENWTVYDVESRKVIAKLEPAKGPKADGWTPSFHLSADGKEVFTVTSSKRELATDEKTGRTTLTLASHLHVWDADTGKWKQVIADAKRVVTLPVATHKKLGRFQNSEPKFQVNHQGNQAIDYDTDAVTVWDLKTGKTVRRFRTVGHTARPEVVHFSRDGQWLVSASTGGEVALWNARTGEPGPSIDAAAHLGDVGFRPKSSELVGVGHGLIYVWNLKTGNLIRTYEHPGNLFKIEFHPDGKLAAIADHWSEVVSLIDLDTGKTIHRLPAGKGKSLAFHPDGSLLALDPHGTVTLWDTTSGKLLQRFDGGKSGNYNYAVHRIAFLPGADRFLLCEKDAVAIIDAKTGKRMLQHAIPSKDRHELRDADVHPDGKRFVVAFGGTQDLEERDLETGKVLRTYPGYAYGTVQVRYHPDGSRLATAGTYAFELHIHQVPKGPDE